MTNQKPTWQEELSEFKEKSANFINGRLSPLAFDKWFVEKLSQAEARGIQKCIETLDQDDKSESGLVYHRCIILLKALLPPNNQSEDENV